MLNFSAAEAMMTRNRSSRSGTFIDFELKSIDPQESATPIVVYTAPIWREVDQWQDEPPLDFKELNRVLPSSECLSEPPSPPTHDALHLPAGSEGGLAAHWWRQLQQAGVELEEVESGLYDPSSPHYYQPLNLDENTSRTEIRLESKATSNVRINSQKEK